MTDNGKVHPVSAEEHEEETEAGFGTRHDGARADVPGGDGAAPVSPEATDDELETDESASSSEETAVEIESGESREEEPDEEVIASESADGLPEPELEPESELEPELEPEPEPADVPVESAAMPTSGAGEGLVRALSELRAAREELEEVQAAAKAGEERLLRLGAEFENYKKRVTREREEDRKFANERLLKELLPVVDNLERAVEASEGASSTDQVASGVQMVLRQLLDTLKKFDVTRFSALNEAFNPAMHEAMQQMETTTAPPGTVVSEYMKGYLLNERLLRPAMVVVATAPREAKPTDDGGGEPEASEPSAEEKKEETGNGEGET